VLPWIAWTDERDGLSQAFASLFLDELGQPPLSAPVNGFAVAPSSYSQSGLTATASSLDNSLLAAWSENRDAASGSDIYVMRLTGNGSVAPGWPSSGLRVCGAAGDQLHPRVLDVWDGARFRIFVTWEDSRSGPAALYGTAVGWDGTYSLGFPPDGIAISSGPAPVHSAALESLTGSFMLAVWEQDDIVRAQAVTLSGALLSGDAWPAGGVALSPAGVRASHAVALHAGGVLVAWQELHGDHTELWAHGWNSLGVRWSPESPVAIERAAPGHRLGLQLRSVDLGRVMAYWQDQRDDPGDVYFNELTIIDGTTLLAGPAGQPLIVAPGQQGNIAVASGPLDAFFAHPHGGMFWEDSRSAAPRAYGVFDALESQGFPICSVASRQTQLSTSYQEGVFIPEHVFRDVVVWTDHRNPATAPDLYAQLIGPDRPAGVEPPPTVPARTRLSGARPSPTRGPAEFLFELAQDADVSLDIVDVAGRVVRSLSHERMNSGSGTVRWDGRDSHGVNVSPGLYWLRGRAGGERFSSRVVMLGD
jgi:hypothetical protein